MTRPASSSPAGRSPDGGDPRPGPVDDPIDELELLRWSEALAGIARTGLGFTDSHYERERFEEVLAAARMSAATTPSARSPSGSPRWARACPATSPPKWPWERS